MVVDDAMCNPSISSLIAFERLEISPKLANVFIIIWLCSILFFSVAVQSDLSRHYLKGPIAGLFVNKVLGCLKTATSATATARSARLPVLKNRQTRAI